MQFANLQNDKEDVNDCIMWVYLRHLELTIEDIQL